MFTSMVKIGYLKKLSALCECRKFKTVVCGNISAYYLIFGFCNIDIGRFSIIMFVHFLAGDRSQIPRTVSGTNNLSLRVLLDPVRVPGASHAAHFGLVLPGLPIAETLVGFCPYALESSQAVFLCILFSSAITVAEP